MLIIRSISIHMQLKTTVLAKPSTQLNKQLLSCFDHQVQILEKQTQQYVTQRSTNELSIEHLLDQFTKNSHKTQCFIAYKLFLNLAQLHYLINTKNQLSWQARVSQYDPKTRKIIEKQHFVQNGRNCQIPTDEYSTKKNQQSTFIVDLVNCRRELVRIYLLPFSRQTQEEDIQVTRARHQNFKLLKIVKQYVSLQCNCDTQLVFQQPVLNHLASFLYLEQVYHIRITVWIQNSTFDHSLLKKIGQIKLPEPWLQKQQYRKKKKEIYDLKTEQFQLISTLKGQKQSFIENITSVQQIAGLPVQSYSEIDIETLKKIRNQNLTQKTREIKDLQGLLNNLQIRLGNLQKKKEEYVSRKAENEKKHILQILQIKRQISLLQEQNRMGTGIQNNSALIYSRVSRPTQAKTAQTVFTSSHKQSKSKLSDYNQDADNRQSEKTQKALPVSHFKKNEFKNNEKKVASVVKETNPALQIDTKQLCQNYEAQISKIDFQMEKRYVQMLAKYSRACQQLSKVVDDNDGMDI